jgi:hypothetical protein
MTPLSKLAAQLRQIFPDAHPVVSDQAHFSDGIIRQIALDDDSTTAPEPKVGAIKE